MSMWMKSRGAIPSAPVGIVLLSLLLLFQITVAPGPADTGSSGGYSLSYSQVANGAVSSKSTDYIAEDIVRVATADCWPR